MRFFLCGLLLIAACRESPPPKAPEPEPAPEPAAPEEPAAQGEGRALMVPDDHPLHDRVEGASFDNACETDADCHVGGCSNEVCSAEEGVNTTCEVRDWPNEGGACGCVQGSCAWYAPGDSAGLPEEPPQDSVLAKLVYAAVEDDEVLGSIVDVERGVGLAARVDDLSDAPPAPRAELLCSLDEVREVLQAAAWVEDTTRVGACEGTPLVCEIVGYHDEPSYTLTFSGSPDEPGRLVSIAVISDALSTENHQKKLKAWVDEQLEKLQEKRCRG